MEVYHNSHAEETHKKMNHLRQYCIYPGTKTNQILSHGDKTIWNHMTAETQISSTATKNKVRHDFVCLCIIIERGKER